MCSYEVMLKCWSEQPEKRPPFAELVKSFTVLLEQVVEYMDFSLVSGDELKNTGYNQLERYNHGEKTTDDDKHHLEDDEKEPLKEEENT